LEFPQSGVPETANVGTSLITNAAEVQDNPARLDCDGFATDPELPSLFTARDTRLAQPIAHHKSLRSPENPLVRRGVSRRRLSGCGRYDRGSGPSWWSRSRPRQREAAGRFRCSAGPIRSSRLKVSVGALQALGNRGIGVLCHLRLLSPLEDGNDPPRRIVDRLGSRPLPHHVVNCAACERRREAALQRTRKKPWAGPAIAVPRRSIESDRYCRNTLRSTATAGIA